MPDHRLRVAAAVLAAACATPAATAGAATRSVDLGPPPDAAKALGRLSADADAFFPRTTTIHVGDSVRFVPVGYHTVDLPRRGGAPSALFSPTGSAVRGERDAAGEPFWFNGHPQLAYAPIGHGPAFGRRLTYDGRRALQSGAARDKRTPLTVRFTRAGTYRYFCDVHPGMSGRVRVLARGARIPSAREHDRTAAAEVRRALDTAEHLGLRRAATGVVHVGLAAQGGVEILGFVPHAVTVAAGDSLTFAIDDGSLEIHTATTGPGDPQDPASYLGALAVGMQSSAFPGAGTYPSDPPAAAPAALSPALHGNGFWNSGLIDDAASTAWGSRATVRFTSPGSYRFTCLIHPYMAATVTVT